MARSRRCEEKAKGNPESASAASWSKHKTKRRARTLPSPLMRAESSSRGGENGGGGRRSKKVESERRKIYGEMKSFRSRTLIKTTFSPFASFSFPPPLIFTCSTVSRSRRSTSSSPPRRLLLGAFLFSPRWLVEFTIIADYFSVIYSLPPPRCALSLTLICIDFTHRLMDETLGTLSCEQMPSASSRSRISHANIVGFSRL